MFKTDANERSDILCGSGFRSVLYRYHNLLAETNTAKRAYNSLPVLLAQKPNVDRLINKEHVCKLVPRVRVMFELDLHNISAVLDDRARAQLHEQVDEGEKK